MAVHQDAGRAQFTSHANVSCDNEQNGQDVGSHEQENAVGYLVPVFFPALLADFANDQLVFFSSQSDWLFVMDDKNGYKDETGYHPNGQNDTTGHPFIEELSEDDWMADGKVPVSIIQENGCHILCCEMFNGFYWNVIFNTYRSMLMAKIENILELAATPAFFK